jgi:hypothetical protein
VTALMAWPNFHREMETEVENQVAAPAETRTPNWHRAKQKSLIESADGRVATGLVWARKKRKKRKNQIPGDCPFPSWRNGDRAVLAVKGSLTPQRTRP